MATTTNYSWTTPDDTALVKDGAAAIRSLGTAIDSTVFTNAGNAIAKTIVDAKGDLIVATAADTVARLASSASNGDLLTVDTSTASGLKWAAPAASGGMTLISTTTFNNTVATYTLSSIPQTYKHLLLVGSGLQSANAGDDSLFWRFNGDTGTNYLTTAISYPNSALTSVAAESAQLFNQTNSPLAATGDTSIRFGNFVLDIYNYSATQYKSIAYVNGSRNNGGYYFYTGRGHWNNTAAITSITFTSNQTANLKAGIVQLYGVS
jgi:hypothetical protein